MSFWIIIHEESEALAQDHFENDLNLYSSSTFAHAVD